MNTPWLDSGIRQIACASISRYQRHISPHKGFSCAHRLLYGDESCSQYIKRIIAQKGLAAAIKASRQRFKACRKANQILRAIIDNSESEDEDKPKKPQIKAQNNRLDPNCCQCAGESLNCGSCLACDLSGCNLVDCGSCGDCSSGFGCSGP